MPFLILSVVVQGLTIFHVLRTGRDMRWIFLILFVPIVGSLVYFAIEVMPSLGQNLTARRAMRRVRDTVDPNRGIRANELDYERNPTIDTASRLADELSKAGRFEEAIEVCAKARGGMFENDPKILLSLARAEFGAGRFDAAIATLDKLRNENPGFRSPEGHLFYARALEDSGASERALEEYSALARYFPGAEARVRHALLEKKLGRHERAAELLAEVLKDARLAPKHFQKSQREWINLARRESEPGRS